MTNANEMVALFIDEPGKIDPRLEYYRCATCFQVYQRRDWRGPAHSYTCREPRRGEKMSP